MNQDMDKRNSSMDISKHRRMFFCTQRGVSTVSTVPPCFCLMIWHKNLAEFGKENRAASERIESQ